jgi:hypothetical protein
LSVYIWIFLMCSHAGLTPETPRVKNCGCPFIRVFCRGGGIGTWGFVYFPPFSLFIPPSHHTFSFFLWLATGWKFGVRFSAGTGNFSLHHRVQNGSGAHPPSYPMGTGGFFPRDKATGAWNWPITCIWCRDQSMRGAIPPLPQYAFMAWCLVKAQGPLTILVISPCTEV